MSENVGRVRVLVEAGPEADAKELVQLTDQLRHELLKLDVKSVERISLGPPPDGARAIDVAALGELVVNLGPAVIGAIAAAVQGWMKRSRARSVKMEVYGQKIEITGIPSEEQGRLIRTWLQEVARAEKNVRHSSDGRNA